LKYHERERSSFGDGVAMDFYEVIEGRHSVRSFTMEPIPRPVLDRLLAAAAKAPSAMNAQPWRFHVASGRTREAVGHAMAMSTLHLKDYIGIIDQEHLEQAEQFFASLGGAPVVVAVSSPTIQDDLDRINAYLSVGCALENLLLAATAEGLGTCSLTFSFWVRDELAEVLDLPDGREVVALVVLGYPAEKPVAPPHNLDIATFHD
jgi:nitroreductase